LAAGIVGAASGDLQAQIQYAFQTEDTNRPGDLIQDLTAQVKEEAGEASLRYHLAHAQYRPWTPRRRRASSRG